MRCVFDDQTALQVDPTVIMPPTERPPTNKTSRLWPVMMTGLCSILAMEAALSAANLYRKDSKVAVSFIGIATGDLFLLSIL